MPPTARQPRSKLLAAHGAKAAAPGPEAGDAEGDEPFSAVGPERRFPQNFRAIGWEKNDVVPSKRGFHPFCEHSQVPPVRAPFVGCPARR